MAFTQAQLEAQIDSASTGRVVTIGEFLSNPSTITDVYAVGVIAPYAGRSRWVQILQTRIKPPLTRLSRPLRSAALPHGDLMGAFDWK